jgi:hypothetical protein
LNIYGQVARAKNPTTLGEEPVSVNQALRVERVIKNGIPLVNPIHTNKTS